MNARNTLEIVADGAAALDATFPDDTPDTAIVPTPELGEAAYAGPLGALVRVVEPHTEAHPAAILFSALTMFGAMIGRRAAQYLGQDGRPHPSNLFVMIVGNTSDGRKGVAVHCAKRYVCAIEPNFERQNIVGGMSTGEGLISRVRDDVIGEVKGERKIVEPGITDKRLLVIEEEIGTALRRASGKENSLLHIVRLAWDAVSLSTLTRRGSMTATDPHIAIIGQTTSAELLSLTTDTDFAGGTINRFLICHAERVRLLADDSEPDDAEVRAIQGQLRDSLAFARAVSRLTLSELARVWWRKCYEGLTTGAPGRYGQATRRGAPIVRRLAGVYALSQRRSEISSGDLEAALAIWNYSCASARRVFGSTTLSLRAERFLARIEQADADGATRTELRAVVGNRVAAGEINSALIELRDAGLVRVEHQKTNGRPVEIWRTTSASLAQQGKSEYERDERAGMAQL